MSIGRSAAARSSFHGVKNDGDELPRQEQIEQSSISNSGKLVRMDMPKTRDDLDRMQREEQRGRERALEKSRRTPAPLEREPDPDKPQERKENASD
jgi:hypothetical protein